MKRTLLLLIALSVYVHLNAQQTGLRVYQILQTNCATASCHTGAAQAGGLDLEGTGPNDLTRLASLKSSLEFQAPTNATAASNGNSILYPGRVDKSFLFRKINEGLEPTLTLEAGEMPSHGDAGLTDVEKEMIRQWILWGTPLTTEVVEESLLETYYNVGGLQSFPSGPPPAPDPSEGIQIKMGPFFVPDVPNANIEVFQKYEMDFPNDVEVTRVETFMSNFSHHFILYDYNSASDASGQNHGFRFNPDHINVGVVKAIQEPTDLKLPQGAAFFWDHDHVLDFNSHYINYVGNVPYAAEVYLNIYYQDAGNAAQEMQAQVLANTNICVAPNGDETVFDQIINYPFGDVFVWGLMGHTHQLGTGYKIWLRESFQQSTLIYDAACPFGEPGCASPYFDYQHIPMRYYEPFLPVTMNFQNGLIHEASYVNNGNSTVCWGPTSEDEMMVMVIMYMNDTTGVITSTEEIYNPLQEVKVYPNPMSETSIVELPPDAGTVNFVLYDLIGRELRRINDINSPSFAIDRQQLLSGMYIYRLENEYGQFTSGKLMVE
ncbi:MAG: T9SS type A sorting domain-containing protein [Bacteroidota bacterium]